MTWHRCREHRLWDGTSYLDLPDGEGGTVRVPAEYRFAQGLRHDHSAALGGRPDLAAALYDMALWAADEEDLDAAVEALLATASARPSSP